MLKGIAIAFGVTLALALIPVVHFVTVWPAPFIGGFIGGSRARATPVQGLSMGLVLGGLVAAPGLGVASGLALLGIIDGLTLVAGLTGLIAAYAALLGSLGFMVGGHAARRQAT